MHPAHFEGSREIGKPSNMTDEECSSIWGINGVDQEGYPYWLTAWKPSYEDLQALNRGEPIYIKTLSQGLPPMALFTLNEQGESND